MESTDPNEIALFVTLSGLVVRQPSDQTGHAHAASEHRLLSLYLTNFTFTFLLLTFFLNLSLESACLPPLLFILLFSHLLFSFYAPGISSAASHLLTCYLYSNSLQISYIEIARSSRIETSKAHSISLN